MTLTHITQAAEAAKSALRSRDDTIRQAIEQGASHYAAAKAAGMDPKAIARIVARKDKEGTRW